MANVNTDGMSKVGTWENGFPRLYELYRASEQSHSDNYFHKIRESYSCYPDLARRSLGPLEKALESIDKGVWKLFKTKALPLIITRHCRRGWSQLFDRLNEAFGYEFLAKRDYTSIEFIVPGRTPSPDLVGKSKSSTAILEVETINCSDKQIDSLASLSPTVLSWANGLSDGFKNKLLCAVGHARKQLGSFVGPSDKKIVLLVIRMDCECWFNDKNYKEIQELASTQASNDLEVVVRWPEKNEADH